MRLSVRRGAAIIAKRQVRCLSLQSVDRLMKAAVVNGLGHKGNRDWLAEQKGVYGRCYLVPVPDIRLRSSHVRCILVLLSRNNQAVWMSLDVSPWKLLGRARLRGRETARVIGWLASASPAVRWDGSLMQ